MILHLKKSVDGLRSGLFEDPEWVKWLEENKENLKNMPEMAASSGEAAKALAVMWVASGRIPIGLRF